jgi:hypothetical protein
MLSPMTLVQLHRLMNDFNNVPHSIVTHDINYPEGQVVQYMNKIIMLTLPVVRHNAHRVVNGVSL